MAAAKKYSVEQIVAKLREHEKLQGQGLTIPQACKRIGISDQTFYRWRLKYGALKEDEAVGHAYSSVPALMPITHRRVPFWGIDDSTIPLSNADQAATGSGSRSYSRSRPPNLARHRTAPDGLTGSERAIGVRSSIPRCGRARL